MKVRVLKIIDSRTLKASSTTYTKHSRYGKYVTKHKRYLVDNYCFGPVEVGQELSIVETRPLSKRKRWVAKKS